MKFRFVCFIGCILFLYSCKEEVPITSIPVGDTPREIQSVVAEDFGFLDPKFFGDYLVTLSAYGDSMFYVFDPENFSVKLTFGRKGKSPVEFSAPIMYQDNIANNDDTLRVFDLNRRQNVFINLRNILLGGIPEDNILSKRVEAEYPYPLPGCIVDGKTLIGTAGNTSQNEGPFYIFSIEDKEIQWVKDEFVADYSPVKQRRVAFWNYLGVHPENKIVCVAYRYFPMIQFYKTDGTLLKSICLSELKELPTDGDRIILTKAPIYTLSTMVTDRYCYILSASGISPDLFSPKNSNPGSDLLVFDWDGNFVKSFHFNKFFQWIIPSQDDSFMIGCEPVVNLSNSEGDSVMFTKYSLM